MGVEVYLQAKDGGGGARRFRHRESGIEILESRSKVGSAGSSVRFKEQRRILRLGFMSKSAVSLDSRTIGDLLWT
jgi:hypothetical protein